MISLVREERHLDNFRLHHETYKLNQRGMYTIGCNLIITTMNSIRYIIFGKVSDIRLNIHP